MKFVVGWFVLLITGVSVQVSASTQVLFGNDGRTATILFVGVTENPDAVALYSILNVPPVEQNGKLTKMVVFTDTYGVQAFSAVCVFSKLVIHTGSCVLKFNATEGVILDPSHSRLSYTVRDGDAQRLGQLFVVAKPGTDFFVTSDGHFSLSAAAPTFSIQYK